MNILLLIKFYVLNLIAAIYCGLMSLPILLTDMIFRRVDKVKHSHGIAAYDFCRWMYFDLFGVRRIAEYMQNFCKSCSCDICKYRKIIAPDSPDGEYVPSCCNVRCLQYNRPNPTSEGCIFWIPIK